MKSLLEAGVHFGHQTRRWNPKMKRYIFTQRNGIHIIDLQQTLGMINNVYQEMVDLVAQGGKVLFVGTKRQAQEVIQSEAERCGMLYVNQRWLGGTMTNFLTIKTRIAYMLELQQKRDQGYFRVLPKKEGVKLRDKLTRLEKYFTGVRDMTEVPKAIFVIDIGREDICIAEAQRLGVDLRDRRLGLRPQQSRPHHPWQRRRRSFHTVDHKPHGIRCSRRARATRSHVASPDRRDGGSGRVPVHDRVRFTRR